MMLSLKPQHINLHNWYYETQKGIEIIHEGRDANGKLICSEIFTITWNKIANSLKRRRYKK
jgi:polyphosphate kinase 2 (PPK2 family)